MGAHFCATSHVRASVRIWKSFICHFGMPFLSLTLTRSLSLSRAPYRHHLGFLSSVLIVLELGWYRSVAGSLVEFSTKCVYVSFANCVCVRVSVCRHENYIPLALAAGQEEFAMQRKTHIPNGEKHCVPSGVSRNTGKSFSGTVYP